MKKLFKPAVLSAAIMAVGTTAAYADHPISPPKVYFNLSVYQARAFGQCPKKPGVAIHEN